MSCTTPPCLTADELDDLFYLARVNEKDEIEQLITELAQKFNCSPKDILLKAQDPESGNTVLHYCSANGFLDLLKALLNMLGAGEHTNGQPNGQTSEAKQTIPLINTANKQGNTSLHWASLNGHLEVVKLLVDAGADLTVKNAAGHSAAFEAERAGKGLVVEYLLDVGGLDMDSEDLADGTDGQANGSNGHEQLGEDVDVDMDEAQAGPSG